MGDFVSGYYALDVTHPDTARREQQPDPATVPSCLSTTNGTVSGCGTLPYPGRPLGVHRFGLHLASWTRTRTAIADLGQTWSVPTVGRIKVIEGGNAGRQVRRHLRRRHGRRQQDSARSAATGSTWWTSRPARRSTSASSSAPRRRPRRARRRPRRLPGHDLHGHHRRLPVQDGHQLSGDAAGRHARHQPGDAGPRRRPDGEADHRHVVGIRSRSSTRWAGRSTSRRRSSTSPGWAASPSPSAPATARASGTSTARSGRFYVIVDDNFTSGGATAQDGGELRGHRRHREQRQLLDRLPAEPHRGQEHGAGS